MPKDIPGVKYEDHALNHAYDNGYKVGHKDGVDETLKQVALTLGWGNVPPISMMLREIRILQERSRKLGITK